jgi:hypothetical protein
MTLARSLFRAFFFPGSTSIRIISVKKFILILWAEWNPGWYRGPEMLSITASTTVYPTAIPTKPAPGFKMAWALAGLLDAGIMAPGVIRRRKGGR